VRVGGEESFKGSLVGDVQPVEAEIGLWLQPCQAPLFEARVVGVVDVVYTYHQVAVAQQQLGDLRADESRAAGYKVAFHHLGSLRSIDDR